MAPGLEEVHYNRFVTIQNVGPILGDHKIYFGQRLQVAVYSLASKHPEFWLYMCGL